jgi:hypothetical protein
MAAIPAAIFMTIFPTAALENPQPERSPLTPSQKLRE